MAVTSLIEGRMYIDGRFIDAASGETRESISPSTGRPWAVVPEAGAADVDVAVAAARAAMRGEWGATLPRERAKLLNRVADLIEERADELAELEVRDNGKTIREMRGQYGVIPEWLRYYAGGADKLEGRALQPDRHGVFNFTINEPVGVVGAITPWNSPGLQTVYKAAPALTAGNAIVIKPSEHTPMATLEYARIFDEAGFPPGAFNVITGGAVAGAALSGHPDVDLVAFTGSTPVGRKVGAAAGEALSDVILELGGKAPQVVFEDADLEAAAIGIMTGICVASGQSCVAGSRVFVQSSIADELTAKLVERFEALRVGDPLDPETEIGPVCFVEQFERISNFVEYARQDGARALTGGRPLTEGRFADGYYFEPTIFAEAENSMRFMREEIFGPVMGLATFETEAEALELANDTRTGLCAGIWTRDLARAHRLVGQVEAGTVWVNTYRVVSYQSPLAAHGDSGVGFENSLDSALRFYTRPKSVWIDYSEAARDPFRIVDG